MKEHISITIDKRKVQSIKKYSQMEKRSVSQVVELAVDEYLDHHMPATANILTSRGSFKGGFSREETYAGR